MQAEKLSRRRFLKGATLAAAGVLVAACQPQVVEKIVPGTPQIVEKIVPGTPQVVEKVVKETIVVAPTPGPKMTLWAPRHFIQAQNDFFTASAQLAAARNDFEVEVQLFPWGEFNAKQMAAIEAGTVPDVIVGIDAARYTAMGVLEDVDALFHEIGATGGGWYPANEANVTVGGKAVGIPFHNEPQFMYYRSDVFTEAGFTVPPQNLDEFTEAAVAVTDPAANVFGFGNTFADAPDGNNFFYTVLWAFGGTVQNEQGEIVFNSQESIDALTWYTDLFLKYEVMPEAVVAWDDTGNNRSWLAGQCMSIYNTGSVLYAMRQDDPGFLEHSVFGPLPAGPAGPKILLGGSTVGIMKGTVSHEQSAELIRGILSPERYPGNLRSAGGMFWPVLQAYANDPFFMEDPFNQQIIVTLPYAQYAHQPGPLAPWIGEIVLTWAWSRMAASVALHGVSPAEAVATTEKELQEMKAKYEPL